MGSWRQRGRLAVIAGATFVLLVVVLPQVAGGLGLGSLASRLDSTPGCSSGSSGSGAAAASGSSSSSQCGPQNGTVAGTVKVTGAPHGFSPGLIGAGACPAAQSKGQICPSPQYGFAFRGHYSLSLPAGRWRVTGFYELGGLGGVFTGTTHVVDVVAGTTLVRNLTVPYEAPATVSGTIKVTGVPKGVAIEGYEALLCPSYAPYTGAGIPIVCVTSGQVPDPKTKYSIDTLPPGTWIAYPQYQTEFGVTTNAAAGTTVHLRPGQVTTADLTTPYLTPADGIVAATVTVTGAPAGFSDPIGLEICTTGSGSGFCGISSSYASEPTNTVHVSETEAPGTYTANGVWLASPFYNEIDGPLKLVTIKAGKITDVSVTISYQSLATAAGTIAVRGLPHGVAVEDYTVLACPASSPWNGVPGDVAVGCVSEFSGYGGDIYSATDAKRADRLKHPGTTKRAGSSPFDTYDLTTLTTGSWILYPGYVTVFGAYVSPAGTTVHVAAGQTTTTNLSVRYQQPTDGVLEGKVAVTGQSGYNPASVGVEACTAPPTATSCPGAHVTYVDENGDYQLSLPPGQWWAAGIAQIYGPSGFDNVVGPSQTVTITAGKLTKADFTVAAT